MNKDDKECSLLNKYSDLPNDLSEALSKHQDEDKAFYYGAFNKQDYFTLQGMQKFRIGCTILNTPIWLVALLVKGWAYFLMYGT